MKARTYLKVAKKLVRNPFPGNRRVDSLHTFLLQEGNTCIEIYICFEHLKRKKTQICLVYFNHMN